MNSYASRMYRRPGRELRLYNLSGTDRKVFNAIVQASRVAEPVVVALAHLESLGLKTWRDEPISAELLALHLDHLVRDGWIKATGDGWVLG